MVLRPLSTTAPGDSLFLRARVEVLHLIFSFEVPTYLNADAKEKFRNGEWLISTILLEISHL
jgi:hypothetical protein